jgi:hypothetical protein
MKRIYLVVGANGIWDDYVHWNVAAYADEAAARRHADAATAAALAIHERHGNALAVGSQAWLDVMNANHLDPQVRWGWYLTTYRVEPIEMEDDPGESRGP